MYHGTKADIMRLPAFHISSMSDKECQSAIIIEMSPIIRPRCSTLVNVNNFSDLAVLLYYYVMKICEDFWFHMCLMKNRHYPTIGMIFSKSVPIKPVLTNF